MNNQAIANKLKSNFISTNDINRCVKAMIIGGHRNN